MHHILRGSLRAVAVAGAVLLAAGCAQEGEDQGSAVTEPVPATEQVAPGVPEGWETQIDINRLGEQILAGWVDEGESFAVVTWGSSTCVPTADTIQVTGSDSVTVVFAPSENEVCTADMAPSTHTLALPEGVTDRPVELTVTLSEFDRSESFELK